MAAANNQSQMATWLLEKGADPKAADNGRGRTALHWAARLGHLKAVKALLQHTSASGCKDSSQREPLHLAALSGDEECVRALVAAGADVNAVDKSHMTALYMAAARGNDECVEILIEEAHADHTIPTATGMFPLHAAALGGQDEAVSLLVALPYGPAGPAGVTDTRQRTPAHYAAVGGHQECLQMLAEKSASSSSSATAGVAALRDAEGLTPLHLAAYNGRDECVRWILSENNNNDNNDKSNSINAVDSRGETAAFKAAASGNVDCLELLADSGADLAVKDAKGRTLLHAAASLGDADVVTYAVEKLGEDALSALDGEGYAPVHYALDPQDQDVYQTLVGSSSSSENSSENALWARRTKDGSTVFHIAAHNGDTELGDLLLERGAPLNVADNRGVTPLMTAVAQEKTDFVQWAVDEDPEHIDQRDARGRTALHWAAAGGIANNVSVLINGGADVNAQDNDGNTPLGLAAFSGNVQAVSMLISAGAKPRTRNAKRMAPIHFACIGGHSNILQKLLAASRRSNVNAKLVDGRTALHIAAHNGHPHLCQILLQAGAAKDEPDKLGRTPLFYAAANDDALVIGKLLDNGANSDIPDADGVLPAQWARSHGFVHCAELLEHKTSGFTHISKVKALFEFNARDPSEISIKCGDIVNVLWQHETGWWKGEINGKAGLFPSNYCKPIEGSEPAPAVTVEEKPKEEKDEKKEGEEEEEEEECATTNATESIRPIVIEEAPEQDTISLVSLNGSGGSDEIGSSGNSTVTFDMPPPPAEASTAGEQEMTKPAEKEEHQKTEVTTQENVSTAIADEPQKSGAEEKEEEEEEKPKDKEGESESGSGNKNEPEKPENVDPDELSDTSVGTADTGTSFFSMLFSWCNIL